MLEGYSPDARRVVSLATAEARQLGHARVGTEHLLLGLLADDDSETAGSLRAAGATLSGARYTVSAVVTEVVDAPASAELPFTARAQRALERAGRFARRAREPEVTADHVLLGVLDVEGLACQVMRGLGVDIGRLRTSLVAGEDEVMPSEDALVEQPEEPPAVRPRCPRCDVDLEGNVAETLLEARAGDESTTIVTIVYCGICGATLGATPAG